MTHRVSGITYNHEYKIIGKHPIDGRLFAVKHSNVNGLFVVDRDLNLLTTLNTTLLNYDGNGIGNGITECQILSTGTMVCWGIYRTGINQTVIWRSTDSSYSNFEPVLTLPNDLTFIEKSVAVSTVDDTIMCCEYTTNPQVGGVWSAPEQLHVWRGSSDAQVWDIAHTRNRVGEDIIRHFHSVRFDVYENKFWITTGDWNGESSIATIDPDGSSYTRVVQADPATSGQQERTTSLMFTDNHVWFGSDSYYNEDHYMARIDRNTRVLELLPFLPKDCIRLSDKVTYDGGEYLLANQSYEKAPSNIGKARLLVCDDYESGEWYSLFDWDVSDLNTVSVFYQVINNGDGRIYVHCRRINDDTSTARMYTTAIIDVVKVGVGDLSLSPQGKMVTIGASVKYSAIKSGLDISSDGVWESSRPDVVSINAEGVAVTNAVGFAEISYTDSVGETKKTFLTVLSRNAKNVNAAKIHVGDGAFLAVPIFIPAGLSGIDERWRFETEDGIRCFVLENTSESDIEIKVTIGNVTKKIRPFD